MHSGPAEGRIYSIERALLNWIDYTYDDDRWALISAGPLWVVCRPAPKWTKTVEQQAEREKKKKETRANNIWNDIFFSLFSIPFS